MAANRWLNVRQILLGNMIDARSIKVIHACHRADVAVICRVDASFAAKRVTIWAPEHVEKRRIHAALSAILLNKVKNLGAIFGILPESPLAPRYYQDHNLISTQAVV